MASFISAFHDDLKQHPLFTQIQSSIDRFLATSEHATVWVIVSAVAAMVLAATLASAAVLYAMPNTPTIAMPDAAQVTANLKKAGSAAISSSKHPGSKGAPSFAAVARKAAVEDASDDEELPAAHAGEDGAPTFAEMAAGDKSGLKQRK